MNTDKIKKKCVGKKHSQDMYETQQKRNWGTTEFNSLGLQFSVDLNKIPATNYSLILNKIEKNCSGAWKRRNLTPLREITILKTFVLSSLNHIFASLPSPDKKTISSIPFCGIINLVRLVVITLQMIISMED